MKRSVYIVGIFLLAACSKPRPAFITGKEGQPLPTFNILLPEDAAFYNTGSLAIDKPSVLFYFSPTCPHCRVQMRSIIGHIGDLRDIQFCLITNGSFKAMKNFYDLFKLKDYPNIRVGIDTGYVFADYFKVRNVPFLALYNDQHKLNKAYKGSITNQTLLDGLKP